MPGVGTHRLPRPDDHGLGVAADVDAADDLVCFGSMCGTHLRRAVDGDPDGVAQREDARLLVAADVDLRDDAAGARVDRRVTVRVSNQVARCRRRRTTRRTASRSVGCRDGPVPRGVDALELAAAVVRDQIEPAPEASPVGAPPTLIVV